jgi:hypothetical protein
VIDARVVDVNLDEEIVHALVVVVVVAGADDGTNSATSVAEVVSDLVSDFASEVVSKLFDWTSGRSCNGSNSPSNAACDLNIIHFS